MFGVAFIQHVILFNFGPKRQVAGKQNAVSTVFQNLKFFDLFHSLVIIPKKDLLVNRLFDYNIAASASEKVDPTKSACYKSELGSEGTTALVCMPALPNSARLTPSLRVAITACPVNVFILDTPSQNCAMPPCSVC